MAVSAVETAAKTDESAKSKVKKPATQSTKVIFRRLPRALSEQEFLDQISPLPDHNYVNYELADESLAPHCFCRAYLGVKNADDVMLLRDRFNGYVFVDSKGNESTCVVELAPNQKIPKGNPRKAKEADAKSATLDTDPDFVKFLEQLANPERIEIPSLEKRLEEVEQKTKERQEELKKMTPLIEHILQRKEERLRRQVDKKRQRDEERRRRFLEQKEKEQKRVLLQREQKEKQQLDKEKREKAKVQEKPKSAPNVQSNHRPVQHVDSDGDLSDGARKTSPTDFAKAAATRSGPKTGETSKKGTVLEGASSKQAGNVDSGWKSRGKDHTKGPDGKTKEAPRSFKSNRYRDNTWEQSVSKGPRKDKPAKVEAPPSNKDDQSQSGSRNEPRKATEKNVPPRFSKNRLADAKKSTDDVDRGGSVASLESAGNKSDLKAGDIASAAKKDLPRNTESHSGQSEKTDATGRKSKPRPERPIYQPGARARAARGANTTAAKVADEKKE